MRKWIARFLAAMVVLFGIWYLLYELPPRQPTVLPTGTLIHWHSQESEYQGTTIRKPKGQLEQQPLTSKPNQ